MAESRSRRNEDLARLARVSYTRAGRSAVAVALAATMAGVAVPVQALAESAQTQEPAATAQTATAEQAPAFDAKSVANNAGEVAMYLDGESQGTFSVFQVASSWTAGKPKQDANGVWTCTLKITPKAENKIAGHFGDSGYELDAVASKLTLTYTYNKWSGWHAFGTNGAKLSFKKAEQAPAFDAGQAAADANVVKLLLDGKEQGGFSVSQVASSWTAGTPKKGADGKWTCTLTITPKAEDEIAGHFGDSGYELDAASSKLTLTYTYNKWSGWHAFNKGDWGTLAFKKVEQAPEFDVSKQKATVVVYDAGEFYPAYKGEIALDASKAAAGKVYKKDGKWAVDVTLKQGTPADWGVADKTSEGVYLADDWNSVTEVTYVTKDLKSSDWEPEGDAPKVAFYQVEQPTTDDVVNVKVTVKTTDGSKQEDYYLDADTYEIGSVVRGYANPMCVVTLKADKQQAYADEFNGEKDANGTYELAAKPNDIQFYFSYDPETREWSNTTTDQYIYVKKAEATPAEPTEPTQPTEPTNPTNPTNSSEPSNNGQTTGNATSGKAQGVKTAAGKNATSATATKAVQPAKQAKAPAKAASAKATSAKANVPKTADANSLAGMATAGMLGIASLVAAAVARVLDLRRNAR